MSRILIVEDETHLAEGLRFNLEAEGYQVQVCEDGESALDLLAGAPRSFDLLILDVMLPGKDGFQVMSELRGKGQFIPTLMLTARGRADDVLKGFEAGTDDYLPKPFELSILIARIGGLLRRKAWLLSETIEKSTPSNGEAAGEAQIYEVAGRTIDFGTLEIRAGSRVFPLTVMEANLLRYLLRHEGQAVSRKAMLEEVWGVREDTDTRPIDNFIVRLRRYLEDDPANPKHLLTVRGVGYRFVNKA
jgi:two-component system, OmpR family, alkaline phosphatase synthesis response regulator PhoP